MRALLFVLALSAVLVALGACGPNASPVRGGDPEADAGTPEWSGNLQFGGSADDELTGVAIDLEGNLYAVGYRDGTVGASVDPAGNAAAVLLKVSPGGVLQWTRTLDTPETDVFEAVAIDAAGDRLVLAGRTTGAIGGQTNAGKFDALVASVGLDGEGEFALLQFGDETPQRPRRIVRSPTGDLLIGGYNDLYIPTNYLERAEDPFTARIAGDGSESQPFALVRYDAHRTPVTDLGFGLCVARDGSGDLFLTGQTLAGQSRGAFVRRLSPLGADVWTRVLSNVGVDVVAGCEVLDDGTVVVAGASFLQFGARTYGQQDVFVAWLDPLDGAVLRGGQAGSTESEWARGLAVDARGHVFVTGETLGAVAAQNAGSADLFVVEFDPAGAWVGSWQKGTPDWDEPAGIALDAQGRVFVVGNTDGALATERTGRRRDGFLLRADVSARTSSPE